MSHPRPCRVIARPRTLTAMMVVSALVMSTWLVAQPALAAAPAPTVRYTFDGNATDQAGGSALTPAPACPGNPCNTSTGFGSDGAGGYWEWTSSGLNGGGFRVSTAAPIGDTYTLALKFSFDEVNGYRKIVDYENQTSDNGFYFYDGYLEFYPFSEQSPSTYPAGTVLDLVAVRQSTGGVSGTFTVYAVGTDGNLTQVFTTNDPTGESLAIGNGAGGTLLGFFFDDNAVSGEATSAGKVYDLRIWSGTALTPEELEEEVLPPTAAHRRHRRGRRRAGHGELGRRARRHLLRGHRRTGRCRLHRRCPCDQLRGDGPDQRHDLRLRGQRHRRRRGLGPFRPLQPGHPSSRLGHADPGTGPERWRRDRCDPGGRHTQLHGLTGSADRGPGRPGGTNVHYRRLGRTGLKVSPLCLGAMMFGAWGNPDHDESVAVIHAALDAGINFIDTADVYSAGESEEIVGKAIAGRRDEVVLATKFYAPMGEGPNDGGGSRHWIMRECENSLRRLGTDHIDLYQVHRPDPTMDIDETLGALSDLVHQGKVRYLGSSTFPASEIVEAQWTAERRQRERFVSEQPPYSILVRGIEADVLPTCQRHGMGVIPWSPLAGGWLSGQVAPRRDRSRESPSQSGARPLRPLGPRQPGQARGGRRPLRRRRRGGDEPGAHGRRLGHQQPGDHLGHHRPAHHGAAHQPAGRRRGAVEWRCARPDRRDRPARDQLHLGRCGLHASDGGRGVRAPPPAPAVKPTWQVGIKGRRLGDRCHTSVVVTEAFEENR